MSTEKRQRQKAGRQARLAAEQKTQKRKRTLRRTITIVVVAADGGWKYLSTGAWSDNIDDVVERAKSIIYF